MLIEEYQEFLENQLLEDKRIKPHTVIFTREHCLVLQLEDQFSEDVPNEVVYNTIAELAGEKKAYRVLLIAEVQLYRSEEVRTQEEIDKVLEADINTLEHLDAYQIVEITKHDISLILKTFTRLNDEIQLGVEGTKISNSEMLSHSYKCIQDNLTSLM